MTLWETLASMKVPLGHHLKKGDLGGDRVISIRRGVSRKDLVPWNCRQVEPILKILASGEPELDV